ncbi:hypothetical protein N7532_007208 [Penicillium argentinense]|uniref:Uncharacterized protein n=1 Tax=Penicillium argentinense TaxID=1131581 RepID=A0A9W9F797_9EURO|nr:uncharacterized protein N7532_010226 [Penicillium argentinense]XP_056473067.1 uncharacterized protein N7532_007208 [Penicillium argentinense]KAJ5085455.1 hypothetical protein N7532_010226 [Penicillium argentinense]KAJ5094917.1 hypothetical protein N7532_007208 [Penicillium argentinense]
MEHQPVANQFWYPWREMPLNQLLNLDPSAENQDRSDEDLSILNQSNDTRIIHERNEATADPNEQPEPQVTIPLSGGTHDVVETAKIEHVISLPEYPQTHDLGYAYVVNLRGLSYEQASQVLTSIQYSYAKVGTETVAFNPFLGCKTRKRRLKCTGVSICTFAHPLIMSSQHYLADEDLFTSLSETRRRIKQEDSLTLQQKASMSFYQVHQERFHMKTACKNSIDSCKLVYGTYHEPTIDGIHHPFLACSNRTLENRTLHFHRSLIGKETSLDIRYLQYLVDGNIPSSFDHCGVVEPRSTRRKDCGIMHPQGQASFLQSPALREYCQERKCMTLSQIHKSFVNMDRFRAVLTKQRAFRYPKGRDIAGIQHELHRDPTLQSYIREVYDNEYGLFVFCALEAQIRYLASLDSFEVDMSYKRVKGDVIEVIFATLIQEHGKIFTLFRVFTDQESPNAYEFIFSRVFYLIQKITNESVSGSTSRE